MKYVKYILKNGEVFWGEQEVTHLGLIIAEKNCVRQEAPAVIDAWGTSYWYVKPSTDYLSNRLDSEFPSMLRPVGKGKR